MGKLDVHITHGGGNGWLIPAAVVAGLAIMGGGAGSMATHAISGLTYLLVWVAGALAVSVAVMTGLLVRFRRSGQLKMVRRGDQRDQIDAVVAEKRAELARIRAMRLQIEAARIAGVEITPELLSMAEDPELADLVMRFRAAANGQDYFQRLDRQYPPLESGPRGHDAQG